MKRANYILTIQRSRNEEAETIICEDTNLILFLLIEEELGRETVILYSQEISIQEVEHYYKTSKKHN